MRTRVAAALLSLATVATCLSVASGAHATGFVPLIGSFHSHSGYSDGWPGSTPANYFASAKGNGMDFFFGGEHSDNFVLPVSFSHYCTDNPGAASLECTTADSNKAAQVLKWQAQLDQANAATTPAFAAGRGFEWTSDVYGHIDVLGSTNEENAKTDGGYGVTMETFWSWFTRPAPLGGGDDALMAFAHPGAKCSLGKTDPTCDWNQFAYVAAADARVIGIELFNYNDQYDSYYVQALDKGWHTGAIGAEDVGHNRPDAWGDARFPKTIVLSAGRAMSDIRAALLARRTYAIRDASMRLDFHVNGALMGSRISVAPGDDVTFDATTNMPAILEVVTNSGAVVASASGTSLHATVPSAAAHGYYFLRARDLVRNLAYSSPVWVSAT